MAVPDAPRWVESWLVDSMAMLGAFLKYKSECEEEESTELGNLFARLHKNGDLSFAEEAMIETQMSSLGVTARMCQKTPCKRCSENRGGYVFRWYSPKWSENYCRMKRPGAWTPGDPVKVRE